MINLKNNCVLRDGLWLHIPENLRISDRGSNIPTDTNPSEGFRCVKSVKP